MDTIKGKRILVTGGCQGIGRGIAIELWRKGAEVVALSNNSENLMKLKNEYTGIEILLVDLCNWNETKKAVSTLKPFDGLVNSAGIIILESFLDCTPHSFDKTVAVNTRALLNVSQVVCQKMIESGKKGAVVNISSQASMAALRDHVAYCASKGAVDSMTRVMALELGAHNIRVNSVNPTAVMTELGRQAWSDPVKSKEMLSKMPLRRFAEVSEVVNAVLFLLSDSASMITGVQLPVDGGFLAT